MISPFRWVRKRLKPKKPFWKNNTPNKDSLRPLLERECPLCGYNGWFDFFGYPPRLDAKCRKCGSLERHRLFDLAYKSSEFDCKEPILHFAPEAQLEAFFRTTKLEYQTADLFAEADLKLNLENIEVESDSFGTVICNHVFEHVDDTLAMKEVYRILKNGGTLIASVPIVEGWADTYENASITDERLRVAHFGQHDHVRFYGRDFRKRLQAAGFQDIREVTAKGEDLIRYGLQRGEKIFVCTK